MSDRPTKITFRELRESGVYGVRSYRADYRCSHLVARRADAWPDDLRLSDIGSASPACGARHQVSCPMQPRHLQCRNRLRAIRATATLDLGELGNDLPPCSTVMASAILLLTRLNRRLTRQIG